MRKYWSYDLVAIEALKYKTRNEFKHNSSGAYYYAVRNKFIDNICLHMNVVGDRYNRFIYKIIFPKINSIYVGLTYNFNERKNSHIKNSSNKHVKYLISINEECIWVCDKEKIKQNKVGNIEKELIIKYKNNGWTVLNILDGGGLGGGNKWNHELVKFEATKYTNRLDFRKKSSGAYYFASRHKILNSICNHMVDIKWTYELIKKEAKKYNNKTNFKENCNSGYYYAHRNNFLNSICKHMKKEKNKDIKIFKTEEDKSLGGSTIVIS